MRDPLHWISVRVKLPLLFAGVCLLAFGVGGTLVSTSARDSLEREILQRLETECDARARALDAALTLLTRRAQDFASDGYVRAHLERLQGREERAESPELRAELTSHLARNKLPLVDAFHDLVVVDPGGAVVASVRSSPVVAASWSAARPAAAPDVWHSGLLGPDEGLDFSYQLIAVPVWNLATTGIVGRLFCCVRVGAWLAAALPPIQAAPNLASQSMAGPGVRAALHLTDRAGRRVNVPDTGEWTAPASIATNSADPSGIFSRSLRIPINGWELHVEVDEHEALAPVSGLQSRFLLVGAILAVASGALLFFPMRFLVRPLAELRRAALRVETGDFAVRVPVHSTDEIGDLSNAFNSMAVALAERTGRLEQVAADLRARKLELVAERDRLNAVIGAMHDALILVGPGGDVVLHNAAARPLLEPLLHRTDDVAGHHQCRISSAAAPRCRDCLAHPAAPARSCLVDVAGSTWEVHALPVAASSSGPPGRLLVARDVTDRVHQDERMIHQERLAALGEVAAVMAHELNNPLAAICMFQQMLIDALPSDSPHREGATLIGRNAEVCRRTIRELLDYATGARAEVDEVELASSLDDAVRFVRPLSKRARVDVRVVTGGEDVVVAGDEVQVRQVFVNLLMNALQAIQQGGTGGAIRLTTRLLGDAVVVDVEDDGPGVPEAARARLFRPFFTTKARGDGTGLGLATARRIAELHGGGVELAESRPGRTIFRVSLRRRVVADAPPPLVHRAAGAIRGSGE